MLRTKSPTTRFIWLWLSLIFTLVLFSLAACFGEEEPAKPAENAAASNSSSSGGAAAAGPLKFVYVFSADCAPCKAMDPIITQLETDYKDKMTVERYDATSDQGKKYMADYGLKKNPSYVILDAKGTKLWSNAGEIHKDMLHQQVDSLLQK
ncbi:MAG: thioredoxin domain-containing protein [Caldilineaceae bacterium]